MTLATLLPLQPFQFETVSTIKEINYFRSAYWLSEPSTGLHGPGWTIRIGNGGQGSGPAKCTHTSAWRWRLDGDMHSLPWVFGRIRFLLLLGSFFRVGCRVTCYQERATNLLQQMRGCNSKCASWIDRGLENGFGYREYYVPLTTDMFWNHPRLELLHEMVLELAM